MELEPTGERVIEEFYQSSPENYLIYLFHVVTYNFASRHVQGRKVLDYGCGSGYGTYRMSGESESIIGIDIAEDAVAYAKSHYQADNLQFRQVEPAESSPLPFKDASFDTVLSFQVIEHVHDVSQYLAEIARVLRSGGVFICATPDRSTRLLPGQKPWNMWHVVEYDVGGLEKVLSGHFPTIEMLRMGGEPEVLAIELRRTARLKWLTLPVTLPFVPEGMRTWALRQLKRLSGQGKATEQQAQAFSFDESALTIAREATPSVHIISVAHKN